MAKLPPPPPAPRARRGAAAAGARAPHGAGATAAVVIPAPRAIPPAPAGRRRAPAARGVAVPAAGAPAPAARVARPRRVPVVAAAPAAALPAPAPTVVPVVPAGSNRWVGLAIVVLAGVLLWWLWPGSTPEPSVDQPAVSVPASTSDGQAVVAQAPVRRVVQPQPEVPVKALSEMSRSECTDYWLLVKHEIADGHWDDEKGCIP